MKKILFVLIVVGFLILLSWGLYFFKYPKVVHLIPGNYMYVDFETMRETSSIIAIVETNQRYRQREKMDGFMVTDVKIKKLIKSTDGSIKEGDILPLNEHFYLEWFRILLSSDYQPLTRNENYLLFLGVHPANGSYYILNQNGGRYQITGEETIERVDDFQPDVWSTYKQEIDEWLKNEK